MTTSITSENNADISGFPFSYIANSSGGANENYPERLGLYQDTNRITSSEVWDSGWSVSCDTNLPIYQKKGTDCYMYFNCYNLWTFYCGYPLSPVNSKIIGEKPEGKDTPPMWGWRYSSSEPWTPPATGCSRSKSL